MDIPLDYENYTSGVTNYLGYPGSCLITYIYICHYS